MMKKYNKQIISFIKKLITVHSVNGIDNEVEIINLIASEAKKLNLPYKIIAKNKNHPNIFVGNNFTKEEGLLLISHVDTANVGNETKWKHNPFGGEIADDKMYGRGAIDNKAGIALSLYTLKTLSDMGKLDLAKFVGVSDEEKGADSTLGARYLLDKGLRAKAAIYTYSGNNTITIGHRGQVKLWIKVLGESAHSGSRGWQDGTKGASAIDALNIFLNELNKINLQGKHEVFPNYFFKQTVVFIEGGSISGMVPDKAQALIDTRLLPNQSNLEYINLVKNLTRKFETDKIKFEVKVQTNLPASFIKRDEKIVTILHDLVIKILGKNPEIRGCGPANEGYMFIKSGIPTICGFGISGDKAHASDEYLEIKSISKILDIYTKTALSL